MSTNESSDGDANRTFAAAHRQRRTTAPEISLRLLRDRLGLSLEEFGQRFSIPVNDLALWETGGRQPSMPECLLLHLIQQDPVSVERMIASLHFDGKLRADRGRGLDPVR